MKIRDIYDFLNKFAPFLHQEEWDNAGFLIGDMSAEVDKVLIALDVDMEVLFEAEKMGAGLIISHHPVIFKAQKSFTAGNIGFEAAKRGIAILSAHTNFDAAVGGVNDVLAKLIELDDIKVLQEKDEEQPMLRQGIIKPCKASDFAAHISSKLSASIRFCLPEKEIRTVAVCGGAGGSFLPVVIEKGFDAFVTGDADHHSFLDAAQNGLALFAAGHFETEQPAMAALANILSKEFSDLDFVLSRQASPIIHI